MEKRYMKAIWPVFLFNSNGIKKNQKQIIKSRILKRRRTFPKKRSALHGSLKQAPNFVPGSLKSKPAIVTLNILESDFKSRRPKRKRHVFLQ